MNYKKTTADAQLSYPKTVITAQPLQAIPSILNIE